MNDNDEHTWRTVMVERSGFHSIDRQEARIAWEQCKERWAKYVKRGIREPAEYDTQDCCELSATLGDCTSNHLCLHITYHNQCGKPVACASPLGPGKASLDGNFYLVSAKDGSSPQINSRNRYVSWQPCYYEADVIEPNGSLTYEALVTISDNCLEFSAFHYVLVPGEPYYVYFGQHFLVANPVLWQAPNTP